MFHISKFSSSAGAQLSARRVVITGLGIVCPLGVGVEFVWEKLIGGESGVTQLREDDSGSDLYRNVPCKVAAYVPRGEGDGQLNVSKILSPGDERKISPASLFALAATSEALKDSGLSMSDPDIDPDRCGVAVGMGMVELDYISDQGRQLLAGKRINPHFIPRILLNMAAGHISIKYGLRGPNHSVSTACTTGAHAIGDAFRLVRCGVADVMVCGSAEASISPLSIAGFSAMRALSSKYNSRPGEASRPFDAGRDGFVMGEGAGIVILEEAEHARRRGAAQIYGELLGYGMSGDAYHVASPSPDGSGAVRCMQMACGEGKDGSLRDFVSYINAHATSTPQGDEVEYAAIHELFPDRRIHVSSTKGATGHLLGAAGSVEGIFTILACQRGLLPPNLNLHCPHTQHEHLPYVTDTGASWVTGPEHRGRRVALTNSFGFGGTNASLCIGEWVE